MGDRGEGGPDSPAVRPSWSRQLRASGEVEAAREAEQGGSPRPQEAREASPGRSLLF